MKTSRFLIPMLLPALLLAGCASYQPPSLPPDHPANPSAPVSVTAPARSSLDVDATTQATRDELSATKKPKPDSQKHDMQGMQGMDHGGAQ